MMSDHSPIEWTEATWNPIAGCSVVSPGCTNCYAMRRVAPRLAANPATPHYAGTVKASKAGPVWTGKIGIASDAVFLKPFRWRRPRMIFVNSTSDLFHPGVPDAVIDRVFAVMALCPQHTFQVLTKRPSRMRDYFGPTRWYAINLAMNELAPQHWHKREWEDYAGEADFLPNVWLGTSVEDQQRADERIPHLLATPAALRFVSAEPLIGPVDLRPHLLEQGAAGNCIDIDGQWWHPAGSCRLCVPRLDWVIVGGESGTGARPMHPDWARSLRDQCAADADVPFFFKQWGEWLHQPERAHFKELGGDRWTRVPSQIAEVRPALMFSIGTRAAGRLLDGVEHNAIPSRSAPARPAMKRTYAEQEDEIDV